MREENRNAVASFIVVLHSYLGEGGRWGLQQKASGEDVECWTQDQYWVGNNVSVSLLSLGRCSGPGYQRDYWPLLVGP